MARGGMVAELRQRCRTLRDSIAARELATADEVASYWPKGAENPGTNLWAWIFCYGQMVRLNARRGDAPERLQRASAAADRDVLDALRSEPIPVRLLRPVRDGERTVDTVFARPKSLDAMLHIAALEEQLAHLLDLRERLSAAGRPSADVADKLADGISYCYQLLVWIVTTGDGTHDAAMPYAADDPTPPVPAWVAAIDAWDVVRICQAVGTMNARLAAVTALLDAKTHETGGKRPSWSRLVGTLAIELKRPSKTLAKLEALHELLASLHLSNDSHAPVESGQ